MSHVSPITLHTQAPEKVHAHIDHERLMDCIHCGLCLPQCPTYAETGLEANSPRGRIYIMRALAEERTEPTPELVEHLDLCLGCRACETACPSGVQYGHLLEGTRSYLREAYDRPTAQKAVTGIIENTFPYPARLEAALLPIRVLRRTGVLPLLHRIGFMKLLGPLGDMEQMLPKLPPMRKRLTFSAKWRARGIEQAKVGMITGCVMQVMQSDVNIATAKVLCKAGCEVAAPKDQVCCGALHAHIGAMDEAREFARQNIETFERVEREGAGLDAIIINAAGCGAALKEYPGWFKGDAQWESRATAFSSKVRDVSEFLAQPAFKQRLESLMKNTVVASITTSDAGTPERDTTPNTVGASTVHGAGTKVGTDENNRIAAIEADGPDKSVDAVGSIVNSQPSVTTVTYHDACHLAHGQAIRAQPRELIATVPGLEMKPLFETEMCCGSAGIYNITQPAMAMQLLERKMKHIKATGAKVVVTGNPGCMMQLMLGAKKFDVDVEIVHPVQLLDNATRD